MSQNSEIETRLEELEVRVTHLTRANEELSDVVAEQAQRIETLQARVQLLLDRARDQDAAGSGGHVFGDERPPHW